MKTLICCLVTLSLAALGLPLNCAAQESPVFERTPVFDIKVADWRHLAYVEYQDSLADLQLSYLLGEFQLFSESASRSIWMAPRPAHNDSTLVDSSFERSRRFSRTGRTENFTIPSQGQSRLQFFRRLALD